MRAEAPSSWPLLLSKLKQAYRSTVTHAELKAAGLDSNALLEAHLLERVGNGRGWCAPDCEHGCTPGLDFEARHEEGLVGVACPYEPACWPGLKWYPVGMVEMFSCSAENIFAGLRAANGLTPIETAPGRSVVPVGVLARRGMRLPVVWMLHDFAPFEELCLGLRQKLGGDGLVVLLGQPPAKPITLAASARVAVLDMLDDARGDLHLWRAFDVLDPRYLERRATEPTALFDEVVLEFANIPGERHVVRINGHDFGGFQKSDVKFLRLLYLAAARKADLDVDGGGWVEKFKLQGDEKDHDLEAVREELRRHAHPLLSEKECVALVKTSPARDGRIRLAVLPNHIRFDASLAELHFVGEQQTTSKADKRKKMPGAANLERNLARGLKVAKKLLADARKLGVPGPTEG